MVAGCYKRSTNCTNCIIKCGTALAREWVRTKGGQPLNRNILLRSTNGKIWPSQDLGSQPGAAVTDSPWEAFLALGSQPGTLCNSTLCPWVVEHIVQCTMCMGHNRGHRCAALWVLKYCYKNVHSSLNCPQQLPRSILRGYKQGSQSPSKQSSDKLPKVQNVFSIEILLNLYWLSQSQVMECWVKRN